MLVFQPVLQTGNGALTCRTPECWENISCQFYCCKKMQIFTSVSLCMRIAFLFPDGFQILQTGGYSEDMIPTVSMFSYQVCCRHSFNWMYLVSLELNDRDVQPTEYPVQVRSYSTEYILWSSFHILITRLGLTCEKLQRAM